MNAITPARDFHSAVSAAAPLRPSRAEAEAAVETLLRWTGDNPLREGLRDTPARVARAFEDWFSGYATDPNYGRKLQSILSGETLQNALRTVLAEDRKSVV